MRDWQLLKTLWPPCFDSQSWCNIPADSRISRYRYRLSAPKTYIVKSLNPISLPIDCSSSYQKTVSCTDFSSAILLREKQKKQNTQCTTFIYWKHKQHTASKLAGSSTSSPSFVLSTHWMNSKTSRLVNGDDDTLPLFTSCPGFCLASFVGQDLWISSLAQVNNKETCTNTRFSSPLCLFCPDAQRFI